MHTVNNKRSRPTLLKIDDWVCQPSTDVLETIKKNESKSNEIPSGPEKQKARAVTTNVANMASTFVWQIYSSYEKLLRILA